MTACYGSFYMTSWYIYVKNFIRTKVSHSFLHKDLDCSKKWCPHYMKLWGKPHLKHCGSLLVKKILASEGPRRATKRTVKVLDKCRTVIHSILQYQNSVH